MKKEKNKKEKLSKEKEAEKEKEKQIIYKYVIPSMLVICLLYIIYMRLSSWIKSSNINISFFGLAPWVCVVLILTIFAFIIGLGVYLMDYFENKDRTKIERKEPKIIESKKQINKHLELGLVSFIIGCIVIYYSWNLIFVGQTLWYQLACGAMIIGLVYMFFNIFNYIGPRKVDWLIQLPYYILVEFALPSMVMIIMLLGGLQGKFGYESIILPGIETASNQISMAISKAMNTVVGGLYTFGRDRPGFAIAISIFAIIFMLWRSIVKSMRATKDEWELEECSAKELIEQCSDEDLTKKDLEDIEKIKHGRRIN